jgi:hypothetical protein
LPSLLNIKTWLTHIKKTLFPNGQTENKVNIPVFIICNKFDIHPKLKKFGNEEIQSQLKDTISSELDIKIYHEVSVKDNKNVEYVFNRVIEIITGSNCFVNSKRFSSTEFTLKTHKSEISFDIDQNKKRSFVLKSEKSLKSMKSLNKNKSGSNCCKS